MTDDPKDTPFGRRPSQPSSEFALPPEPRQVQQDYQRAVPDDVVDPAQPDHYRETLVPKSPRDALHPDPVIAPEKRSSKARGTLVRFLNFLITLAFLGAVGFVGLVWYGKTSFEAPGPLAKEDTFVVPKGATFSSIVPGLEQQNIIQKQGPLRIFTRSVRAAGKSSQLKAGEFAFKPGMSMQDVMIELTEGKAVERRIGFPEGWTTFKIMQRIAADERLEGDMPVPLAEGTLLPDTYSFPRGTTRDQILQRMRDAQSKAIREIWNSRAEGLPLKTPAELVILASIVEKETGISSERGHVASVFINRLRKGMKLQTDPTVIYGIWGGEGKPKDHGGLRQSELKKQTPYNTYQIPALPPGPIANPGLAALKATANPDQTEDLFFVADGTGGHAFSPTLQGHNENVKKWREIEAQRKKDAEAESANTSAAPATSTATGDN